MAAQNQISSTSQTFLEVYDITGDVVVLKDGATSMILSVNAINFGLLAEEEQDAIIYAYAGLLNSLNYSIQILITSQTKDVSKYLHQLEEQEELSTDRVRQGQIRQYREFVSTLIRERNVLDKKFYVVIPATSLEMGFLPPSTVVPGTKAPDISTIERSVILERARNILEPKRDHLLGQFGRIGLFGRQLQTQEIIQLFYSSYNPEATEGQRITDSSDYTVPIVSARVQGAYMTDMPQTPSAAVPPTSVSPATPAPQPAPAPVQAEPPVQTVPTTPPQPIAPPQPAVPQQPVTPTPPVINPAPAPIMQPQAAAAIAPQPAVPTPTPGPEPLAPAATSIAAPTTTPPEPLMEQPQPIVPTAPTLATDVQSTIDNMVGGLVNSTPQTQDALAGETPALGAPTPSPAPTSTPTAPVAPASTNQPAGATTQDDAALPPLPEI